jgi:hypothetical protein
MYRRYIDKKSKLYRRYIDKKYNMYRRLTRSPRCMYVDICLGVSLHRASLVFKWIAPLGHIESQSALCEAVEPECMATQLEQVH